MGAETSQGFPRRCFEKGFPRVASVPPDHTLEFLRRLMQTPDMKDATTYLDRVVAHEEPITEAHGRSPLTALAVGLDMARQALAAGLVIVILLVAAPVIAAAQDIDARSLVRQGRAAADVAEIAPAQAQLPCANVDAGLCVKLPPSRWERAANWAIASNAGCAFADATASLYWIGRGKVRERNPLLRSLEHRPLPFGAAKGGMTAGETYIYDRTKKKHPVLTTLAASATAALQCWAAANVQHEATR
jgi:hypothetical protein